MPDVQNQRTELTDMLPRYERISDSIDGQHAVKAKKADYLPIPSDCTNSTSDPRYVAYILRAVYFNVCRPTRDALVGQIFLRPPVLELPDELDFLIEDMNGDGLDFEQLARQAAEHVVPFGRGGLLVDFPPTGGEVTKLQVESGEVRPIIRFFPPWAIRNWLVEKVGTVKKLTLLVLDEAREQQATGDEFDIETVIYQRVYRLTEHNGQYCCSVEVYNEDGVSVEKYDICGQNGTPLDAIPFEPIGSLNNDMDIDEPPFAGLSDLNLAHFHNSADYEELVYLVGQPTPVYAGITADWMEDHFPKGIQFGSRASIPLNEGASAQLLQADPNTLAFEAMKHKEDQMFAVGGKIINRDQKVEKKEAEVEIEAASQKSVLMNIRNNLQKALFVSIVRAASFIGVEVSPTEHKVELNENFDLTSMSSDELRAASEAYSKNEITFAENRAILLRAGMATETDIEKVKTELKSDKELKDSLMPKEPEPVAGLGGETKPKPKPKETSK